MPLKHTLTTNCNACLCVREPRNWKMKVILFHVKYTYTPRTTTNSIKCMIDFRKWTKICRSIELLSEMNLLRCNWTFHSIDSKWIYINKCLLSRMQCNKPNKKPPTFRIDCWVRVEYIFISFQMVESYCETEHTQTITIFLPDMCFMIIISEMKKWYHFKCNGLIRPYFCHSLSLMMLLFWFKCHIDRCTSMTLYRNSIFANFLFHSWTNTITTFGIHSLRSELCQFWLNEWFASKCLHFASEVFVDFYSSDSRIFVPYTHCQYCCSIKYAITMEWFASFHLTLSC